MAVRLRLVARATILLVAAALLASCADSPGSPGSSDSPGSAGASVPSVEGIWGDVSDSSAPSLDFAAGGRVSGTDGCNRLMGHWTQDGATVTLIDLASTMMFCQEIDTWLSAAATAVVDGETLALFNENGDPIGTLQR
jgi:heat shock protein HslJ